MCASAKAITSAIPPRYVHDKRENQATKVDTQTQGVVSHQVDARFALVVVDHVQTRGVSRASERAGVTLSSLWRKVRSTSVRYPFQRLYRLRL
jgi:hypothetical protein